MDHVFMGRVLAIEAAIAQLLALSGHDLSAMHERGCEWLDLELTSLSQTLHRTEEAVALEAVRDIGARSLDQLFSFALDLRNISLGYSRPPPDLV